MHGLINKKLPLLALLLCLILVFLFFLTNSIYRKAENKGNDKKTTESVKFNEKEEKILNAIYNKLDIYNYFDRSNLKSFEIVSLQSFGYYKSESNILYIRVNYNSECNDNTHNCDKLAQNFKNNISEEKFLYFFVKVDIDTYKFIEVIDGISASIHSDWISTDEKIK